MLTYTHFDCRETDTQIILHMEQYPTKAMTMTDITCERWINDEVLTVNRSSIDCRMERTVMRVSNFSTIMAEL